MHDLGSLSGSILRSSDRGIIGGAEDGGNGTGAGLARTEAGTINGTGTGARRTAAGGGTRTEVPGITADWVDKLDPSDRKTP